MLCVYKNTKPVQKKKKTNTVCNNIISHDGNFDMRIKFGIMDTVRNSKLPTKASLWAAPK